MLDCLLQSDRKARVIWSKYRNLHNIHTIYIYTKGDSIRGDYPFSNVPISEETFLLTLYMYLYIQIGCCRRTRRTMHIMPTNPNEVVAIQSIFHARRRHSKRDSASYSKRFLSEKNIYSKRGCCNSVRNFEGKLLQFVLNYKRRSEVICEVGGPSLHKDGGSQ